MLGAIAGDIIGSVYEWNNIKTKDFPLFQPASHFTDDTVLTVALAESILTGEEYAAVMKRYYRRYPDAGYGARFARWATSKKSASYQSWGNGAAMRISPVGWAYASLEETLDKARFYTIPTHDHPEGIKGAQAAAAPIYLARTGATKAEIKAQIQARFGYDLDRTLDQIRPGYKFDVSCQGTVPEAIIVFLESTGFEDAIRNAVSLGGDCDTLTCITGGIAEGAYGVPPSIAERTMEILDEPLRLIVNDFFARHRRNGPSAGSVTCK